MLYVVRMLLGVAQRGALFSYVPEVRLQAAASSYIMPFSGPSQSRVLLLANQGRPLCKVKINLSILKGI